MCFCFCVCVCVFFFFWFYLLFFFPWGLTIMFEFRDRRPLIPLIIFLLSSSFIRHIEPLQSYRKKKNDLVKKRCYFTSFALSILPKQLHWRRQWKRGSFKVEYLTAHNWQNRTSIFFTCPCHKIYKIESTFTIFINDSYKIFVNIWHLEHFRENLI